MLFVDDDSSLLEILREIFSDTKYKIFTANDGYEAIEIFKKEQIMIILVDLELPRLNGIEVLKRIKFIAPNAIVIIITGYATIKSTLEAVKNGAFDYIPKPFSFSEIRNIVDKATAYISKYLIQGSLTHTTQRNTKETYPQDIVTVNSKMLDILEKLKSIAQSDCHVLIQGESGTGKELIAKAIHARSARSNGSYVAVNCAALPEGIIESELFGHEKGAFTSAVSNRIGKIELAHGGTLLLDEITEMPKPLQAKLLRAIQEREIVRVGGNQRIKVDLRIISTTNKNIIEEIDTGMFREDLFYRLCVIPIYIPPLRERVDDISILTQFFVCKAAERMGKEVPVISDDALELLKKHTWAGNVRELENTIERVVALTNSDIINSSNIDLDARKKLSKRVPLEVGMPLKKAEKELIVRTLEDFNGNKEKAANVLGITAKTIRKKLNEYNSESIYNVV